MIDDEGEEKFVFSLDEVNMYKGGLDEARHRGW